MTKKQKENGDSVLTTTRTQRREWCLCRNCGSLKETTPYTPCDSCKDGDYWSESELKEELVDQEEYLENLREDLDTLRSLKLEELARMVFVGVDHSFDDEEDDTVILKLKNGVGTNYHFPISRAELEKIPEALNVEKL